MGDHFVVLVDRLITEATLEAAIESRYHLQRQITSSPSKDSITTEYSPHMFDQAIRATSHKLVECRICHDDDEDINMEIPRSCRGSLKYAHRSCVQRWCNEKGDTTCEICRQQFQPDYTAPPPLFHYGGIPMNLRGNWQIPRGDLHNSHLLGMFDTNDELLDSDFEDYPAPSPKSIMCCCVIAVIFIVLLLLRHTLPILTSGAGYYSSTLFLLLVLRTIGILLPMYVMFKAFTAVQHRRNQQDPSSFSLASSDEESESAQLQPQLHIIHISNRSNMTHQR